MSQLSILIRRVGMAVVPLVLVVGCASSRQEQAARAQLERAVDAYRQAQADPNVQAYAQLRLADAQKALQAAEQAKTTQEKLSLGYVAEKRAQIASIAGATTKTEQDTLQLSRESSDVLLQKRDREGKAARAEVSAAQGADRGSHRQHRQRELQHQAVATARRRRSRAASGAGHRSRADHDPRLWSEIPDRGQRHARGAPAEPKGRGSGPERRGERREQFSISHSRPLRAPSR